MSFHCANVRILPKYKSIFRLILSMQLQFDDSQFPLHDVPAERIKHHLHMLTIDAALSTTYPSSWHPLNTVAREVGMSLQEVLQVSRGLEDKLV